MLPTNWDEVGRLVILADGVKALLPYLTPTGQVSRCLTYRSDIVAAAQRVQEFER